MGNTTSTEVPQELGALSTADDVCKKYSVPLSGKTLFITGATGGIGKETARALLAFGGTVFIGCRSQEKGEALIQELKATVESSESKSEPGEVYPVVMDLSSFESVKQGVQQLKDYPQVKQRGLDCLILNAGVFSWDRELTKDGFELHFGVNHLAHFYLTKLLLNELKKQPAPQQGESSRYNQPKEEARVVVVSSRGHQRTEFDLDDLNFEKRPWHLKQGYDNSKAYNILFSNYLNKLLEEEYRKETENFETHSAEQKAQNAYLKPVQVTANSLHPGVIKTDITRSTLLGSLMFTILAPKSIAQGAATTVYAAIAPELKGKGGLYFSDCAPSPTSEAVTLLSNQEKLWNLSESMIQRWME
eukprot:TRINITY_DN921_c0_g1_i4.p1 TRINITY_DN921_c0_g1~~TRINITY_DN921_c0_g1_i4.p1  ORF type:complete len:373 (-),score=106.55 TRINITY_DN921_c0_g1_i4:117-1196(-)